MLIAALKKELRVIARKDKAAVLKRFFKTQPGQYAADDIFLGIGVPQLRMIAKKYADAELPQVGRLLSSAVHEERLTALLILVDRFAAAGEVAQKEIYQMYLDCSRYVNNWDLVDLSAPLIAGKFLLDKNKQPLYELAVSSLLWQRRIAIVATLYFIRHKRYQPTLKIAKMLLGDEEDLIHKATGWMLREVAKRERNRAEGFLRRYYRTMPRTMLRYAIERFPQSRRRAYLRGEI
ncbi:MAG: DNA alkylation repair protein [Candidatus Omnitrophica bacterium]|nr:DNA alkylation repair protein [Candidatus Omnitrophota bacterium]